MTTREGVLKALVENKEDISGNEIAAQLGVSRNTVWKAINQLRKAGYQIEAATKRGYRLSAVPASLCLPEIERRLTGGDIGSSIEMHVEIDSTNRRAREMAVAGAPHGTVVLADSQSQGRGRFARSFYSPSHSGVYLSVILRPKTAAEQAVMLTSMAAVAVARAMERVADVHAGIKWVNDVYIGSKKACGILCEAGMDFESGQMQYVVMGIGINAGEMEFPPELNEIATSLANEAHAPVNRNELTAALLNELNALYPALDSGAFMEEYRSRSIVLGREITVLRGGESRQAWAEDIDEAGSLLVRYANGEREKLHSGEISVRL